MTSNYISKSELENIIIRLQHKGVLIPYPSKVELVMKTRTHDNNVQYMIYLQYRVLVVNVDKENNDVHVVEVRDRLHEIEWDLDRLVDKVEYLGDK